MLDHSIKERATGIRVLGARVGESLLLGLPLSIFSIWLHSAEQDLFIWPGRWPFGAQLHILPVQKLQWRDLFSPTICLFISCRERDASLPWLAHHLLCCWDIVYQNWESPGEYRVLRLPPSTRTSWSGGLGSQRKGWHAGKNSVCALQQMTTLCNQLLDQRH